MEAFLDTHLFVWLYAGELERISEEARKVLEAAELLISPMVLLETDYLHETKRITVGSAPIYNVLHADLSIEIPEDPFRDVVEIATKLSWTRDPFDRLIVAHASYHRVPLLTKDRTLHKHYRCIW